MGNAYLDLMEKILTGSIIEDPPIVEGYRSFFLGVAKSLGAQKPPTDEAMRAYRPSWREEGLDWPTNAFTMVGHKRLRNFRDLIGDAIEAQIPGDILETGVWRGGASILARATLRAWDDNTRRVFVADSFEGLPPPSDAFPQDGDSKLHEKAELAVSLETVRANFLKFDLLDDRVVFLKGWFKDSMPSAPITQLAVLRLDGDMYQSTLDVLNHMYDKVSSGGWVIVDDYFLEPCRAALSDFMAGRGLSPQYVPIDKVAVYFRKV